MGPAPLDVVRRIESSLAAGGFKVVRDSVAGRQVVVGRRPALRSDAFVLVAVFKVDATTQHLDRFLDEAAQYARTVGAGLVHRGWTGPVVAVAVVDSARSIDGWAQPSTTSASGAVAYPVLIDLERRRITEPWGVKSGRAHMRHLATMQRLVQVHVLAALSHDGAGWQVSAHRPDHPV